MTLSFESYQPGTDFEGMLNATYSDLLRVGNKICRDAGDLVEGGDLLHNAYLHTPLGPASIDCREHWFALFHRMMRQELVDLIRHDRAKKRGGDWIRVPLETAIEVEHLSSEDEMPVAEIIERRMPAELRGTVAALVAGLTNVEAAKAGKISVRSVERRRAKAREFIRHGGIRP